MTTNKMVLQSRAAAIDAGEAIEADGGGGVVNVVECVYVGVHRGAVFQVVFKIATPFSLTKAKLCGCIATLAEGV